MGRRVSVLAFQAFALQVSAQDSSRTGPQGRRDTETSPPPHAPRGVLLREPLGGAGRPQRGPGRQQARLGAPESHNAQWAPPPAMTLQHSGTLQKAKETDSSASSGDTLQRAAFSLHMHIPQHREPLWTHAL